MSITGCGCKICKADLGEYTNDLILTGDSPKTVLNTLESKGVKTTEKLLKRHLSAYSISYPDQSKNEVLECLPMKVDLNKIDFSEYNFDVDNIESIIGYLQKLNLKIYLNQSIITIKSQEDAINGDVPNVPKEVMQNQLIAFQMFKESSGMIMHVNQQEAIKSVESQGLIIQNPTYMLPNNVKNITQREAN